MSTKGRKFPYKARPASRKQFCVRGHDRLYFGTTNGRCCRQCQRENYRFYRSGCTAQQYDAMMVEQCGRCAGCGMTHIEAYNGLHADHDHSNGFVRGLLCNSCNSTVGWSKESPNVLRKLAIYIEERKPR